jgi:hypothetical protein
VTVEQPQRRGGELQIQGSEWWTVDTVQIDRQSTKLLLNLSSADRVSEGRDWWKGLLPGSGKWFGSRNIVRTCQDVGRLLESGLFLARDLVARRVI